MTPSRLFSFFAARRATAMAVAAASLVLVGGAAVAYAEHNQYLERVRAQALSDVSDVRARLEASMANRLVLPDALTALTIAHEGDVAGEFEEFASGLAASHRSYSGEIGEDPAVRSIQLAPQAVVTYVYPLEGNEEAIGHDLLADPARGPAVRRAIEERRFVLAGPFELLQGGLGLVGRAPIYLGEDDSEAFWGFATVVLNFDALASEAGLDASDRNGLEYAIRGRDGLGSAGDVFWGEGDVFAHEPVVLDVLVPNGTWQIAARPIDGWPTFPFRAASLLILGITIALAALVMTFVMRWERERRAVSRVSENLTRLVDSTTSPIVAVDPDRRIVEWNRAMERLTGLGKESARSTRLDDWCELLCGPDGDSKAVLRAVEAVIDGTDESREEQVTVGDPARTVAFTITGRVESDGRLGAVLFGHDITARLEAENVRSENVALARSARLKDEFLAGMSHELRTPLNAIIGLSSVLRRRTFGELTDKQDAYVGQIETSGQHLLGLINDVLDLAKLDAEKIEIDVEECVIESVVSEAVDLVRPMAARGDIAIAPIPQSRHLVRADRRRLRQIILNLCSNAVKFTEPGGDMGVDVETDNDHVAITVWDTGVGIERSKLNLLFEPFQQVDGSLAREQEGSGLGLAIASKLALLHEATIDVDSGPGLGSRFTLRIPRVRSDAEGDQALELVG